MSVQNRKQIQRWKRWNGGVFEPQDVTNMRTDLDRAWNSLAPERRTPEAMDIMAAVIVHLATQGERDPVQLSTQALQAAIREAPPVEHYDFEVLEGDEAIAAVRSVALPNPKAFWPRIADLAKKVYAPGRRIRVTNQLGEM